MTPRPGLEAGDLVTPAQFAEHVPGLNPNTVCQWIRRAEQIIGRKIEPLGRLGPYRRYDFVDLAALEREMRRRRLARGLAA